MLSYPSVPTAIYKIKKSDEAGYHLVKTMDRFYVPNRIYGDTTVMVDKIWKDYATNKHSLGVLLTGSPGSGKSLLAELLSNVALSSGMMVVTIQNLPANLQLLDYISRLKDCILLFDEFDKNFTLSYQNKMLELFSSRNHGKKLFILVANNTQSISPYLLNRPQRLKYHFAHDKLSEDVYDEYLTEHALEPEFLEALHNVYKSSMVFSFDQLSTIVQEHLSCPYIPLDKMLSYLNMHILNKPLMIIINSVVSLTAEGDQKLDDKIEYYADEITVKEFKNKRNINITIKNKDDRDQYYWLTHSNFTSYGVDEITWCILNDTYLVTATIRAS